MRRTVIAAVSAAVALLWLGSTEVASAPPRISVTVQHYFESPSGLWVYNYTMYNDISSSSSVDLFGISPARLVQRVEAPVEWTAFDGYQGDTLGVVWGVTGDANGPDDGQSVYESPYNPPPGANASGFVVKSPLPPGQVFFYAQGYAPLPAPDPNEDDFSPLPLTIWQEGPQGVIPGPGNLPTVGRAEEPHSGSIKLHPPRPNPSSGDVQIGFYLPREDHVSLTIHDVTGRRTRLLVNEKLGAGVHSVVWNGTNDSGGIARAGVYYYMLRTGDQKVAQRRIVLIR